MFSSYLFNLLLIVLLYNVGVLRFNVVTLFCRLLYKWIYYVMLSLKLLPLYDISTTNESNEV